MNLSPTSAILIIYYCWRLCCRQNCCFDHICLGLLCYSLEQFPFFFLQMCICLACQCRRPWLPCFHSISTDVHFPGLSVKVARFARHPYRCALAGLVCVARRGCCACIPPGGPELHAARGLDTPGLMGN